MIKDRDALLTFYDFPAEPPAISGGAGLEHPSRSVTGPCPNCAAKYELIRVEAPPETTDCEITCVSCGGPLRGHQGPFVLKYFLVERPKRRASGR